eukprot:359014-Chlamydomonas_euryale.AAC.3
MQLRLTRCILQPRAQVWVASLECACSAQRLAMHVHSVWLSHVGVIVHTCRPSQPAGMKAHFFSPTRLSMPVPVCLTRPWTLLHAQPLNKFVTLSSANLQA